MNIKKGKKCKSKRSLMIGIVCLTVALLAVLFRVFYKEKIYLFIGDSYAAKLETAGYNTEHVIIYAVPGITAAQLDENAEDFPEMRPDKVVLMVGINSLAEMEEGIIEIEDEKRLIADLKKLYDAPLYVQKVFPVGEPLLEQKPNLSVENVAEYNRLLEAYCEETEGVFFFDPQEGFLDENGYLTHTEDNLHISDDYLEAYYNNVRKAIR